MVDRYPPKFAEALDRIMQLYPSARNIRPFVDVTQFAGGPFAANVEASFQYKFRQKIRVILYELRYGAHNMELMLQYPFMLRITDLKSQEPLVPEFVFAPAILGTAGHGEALPVPVSYGDGEQINFSIRMSADTPGGGYTPQISMHGIQFDT